MTATLKILSKNLLVTPSFSKLEHEAFGGSAESSESDFYSGWIKSSREQIKNAYMLIYERRYKKPLKLLVENPKDVINTGMAANVVVVNKKVEEELESPTSKDETTPIKNKTLECDITAVARATSQDKFDFAKTIFYDETKDEYFKLVDFNSATKFVPYKIYKVLVFPLTLAASLGRQQSLPFRETDLCSGVFQLLQRSDGRSQRTCPCH